MSDATFSCPDLDTFCRLDELGLQAVGQQVTARRAVIECRVVADDDWCGRCGCQGVARGTVTRWLAHEPFGWRPTALLLRVRRYRCVECGHVWRQDTTAAAEPRAKLSRRLLKNGCCCPLGGFWVRQRGVWGLLAGIPWWVSRLDPVRNGAVRGVFAGPGAARGPGSRVVMGPGSGGNPAGGAPG